jgi:hypothetical protein
MGVNVIAKAHQRLRQQINHLFGDASLGRPIRIFSEPNQIATLLSALDAAAHFDIYWSNEHFYQWLNAAPSYRRRNAIDWLSRPIARDLPTKTIDVEDYRFQVIERSFVSSDDKLRCLRDLAINLEIPGAGVAYARVLAKRADYAAALTVARKTLEAARRREFDSAARLTAPRSEAAQQPETTRQYELHVIENQITALERTIVGKNVHRAITRYLGDDDGFLKGHTCRYPFERIDIQENGNCAVCCSQWMPRFSTGNVLTDGVSALDIFNNERSVAARQSMLDGSFKFCDLVKCPLVTGELLPEKSGAADIGENARKALETGKLLYDHPAFVLLAFDQSCNLSCPSCRSHLITEKLDMQTRKEELIGTSIGPLLEKAEILHINPAGELFVSRPLRRLLSKLNGKDYPTLRLHIISNGMLLNRREWDKFPGIHDMVDTIRISTDGATKETFEKLRRGARWETFSENLQFLADLRDRGVYKDFWLSFTYQIDNFREMPAFVDLCRNLSPNAIPLFEKLENWGTFDPKDYKRMAVHHLDHPLHNEFVSIIQQPRMRPIRGRLIADYAGLL